LGLARLDVCLLHNPEYMLSEAAQRGSGNLMEARERFYARGEQAVPYLEGQVAAGRISWYGVSSNTIGRDSGDFEATSLSELVRAAVKAAASRNAKEHNFAVRQGPMSVSE